MPPRLPHFVRSISPRRRAERFFSAEPIESLATYTVPSIYRSKGEREKAIRHLETALKIASPSNWYKELCWIHFSLAELFLDERALSDASTHIERTKSHAVDGTLEMSHAMELQALICCLQHKFEDAKSEASRALDIYEKLGAAQGVDECRITLQVIEEGMESRGTSSNESNPDSSSTGELLEAVLFSLCSAISITPMNGSGR